MSDCCVQSDRRAAGVAAYLDGRVKRMIELVLTFILFVATLPLCVLIAAAIWLVDGRPIFFAQQRCGQNGRPFTLWKFRTLRPASETDTYAPEFALRSHYTRTGGFLRRRRLDELPQLFAVFTGNMALVGPRPERVEIADSYSQKERRRLWCKPGVTGLWQVLAPRTQPIHRLMKYDLYYLRRANLLLDLRILAMTVLVMFCPARLEGREGCRP